MKMNNQINSNLMQTKTKTMNTYEVTSQITGKTVKVKAGNESSAVRKAAALLTGKPATGAVTWHGKHAEVGGRGRYSKPVCMNQPI